MKIVAILSSPVILLGGVKMNIRKGLFTAFLFVLLTFCCFSVQAFAFSISEVPDNTLKLGDDFFDMSSNVMNDPAAAIPIASLLKSGPNQNKAYFKFGGLWYEPFVLTAAQFLNPTYALSQAQVDSISGFNLWYKAGSDIVNLKTVSVVDIPTWADISVQFGTTLAQIGLQKTVHISLSDGTSLLVPVTWDGGTPPYNENVTGMYIINGTFTLPQGVINPNNMKASVRIFVAPVNNNLPIAPIITISPILDTYTTSDNITITTTSTDPDGDKVTIAWNGRLAETAKYDVGKHVITAVAVDEHGAKSQPSMIVFYVISIADGSGGLLLNDSESRIYENGFNGMSVTKYRLNVPSVPGHYASEDFGWVKGLNKNTHQWEILQCSATNNGISFSNILTPGIYTKLEFYYFTPHNCMYNQSNITYTVSFTYDTDNSEPEAWPIASDVSIFKNGNTLEGKYVYSDINGDLEGVSLYKWYRADNITGKNKAVITGVVGKTYNLTSADAGKYLTFEITPVALTGAYGGITGITVQSQPFQVSQDFLTANLNSTAAVPTAKSVSIKSQHLTMAVNGKYYECFRIYNTIKGEYTYEDGNGNIEGTSTYRWYRADNAAGNNKIAITGANSRIYQLTGNEDGKYIFFEVTPKNNSGTATGVPTLSEPVYVPEESPIIVSVNIQVNAASQIISDGHGTLVNKFEINVQKPKSEQKMIEPLAQTGSGALQIGDKIKVSHAYYDNNRHQEGPPIFKWYRSSQSYMFGDMTKLVPISGATTNEYTITQSDLGQYIGFILVPVAQINNNATIGGENYFGYFNYVVVGNSVITSIDPINDINVANGTMLVQANLPQSVKVTSNDGTSPTIPVAWDGGTPAYNGNNVGTYTFSGTLTNLPQGITNPNNLTASVKVIVAVPQVDTPKNLSTKSGDKQINLTWDTVSGATGYAVYQSETSGTGYTETATTTTSLTATGLTVGKTYYFKVKAVKGTEFSQLSSEIKAISNVDPDGNVYDGNHIVVSNESTNAYSTERSGTLEISSTAQLNESKPVENLELEAYRIDPYLKPPKVSKNDILTIKKSVGDSAYGKSQLKTYVLGNVRSFKTNDFVQNKTVLLNAELRYSGSICNVWVEQTNTALNNQKAQQLGQEFENRINTLVTTFFYSAPNVDGDGKIDILCFDIKDGFSGYGSYIGGYFWAGDLFPASTVPDSNECEMFYIDTYPTMGLNKTAPDVTSAFSTLAHEFQHMVNFNGYLENNSKSDTMDTWLNEALSGAAEHMYGGVLTSRINYYNSSSSVRSGHSLLYWDDNGDVLSNYSLSYLFSQYLRVQTKDKVASIFKELIQDSSYDYQAVEHAIKKYIDPNMTFGQFVSCFRGALLLKSGVGLYGFKGEVYFNTINTPVYTGGTLNLRGGGSVIKAISSKFTDPQNEGTNIKYTGITK